MSDQIDTVVDVLVVGSGFAGLSAAIEAAKHSSSVVILEKRKTCGGNSTISDGIVAAPCTPIQKREGIHDSPLLMEQDMLKAGRGKNDPILVKTIAQSALPTLQWLINDIGVKFQDRVDQFGGHSVPRSYTPYKSLGSNIVKPMLAYAKNLGVVIRTNTSVKRLLSEAENDYVMMVEILNHHNQQTENIKVKKAVIIATGGFAGDVSFRMELDKRLNAEIDHTNRPETTAEVLIEVLKLGAQSRHLGYIQLGPWTSPDEKGYGIAPSFASYSVFPYGILINPSTGKL